MERWQEQLKDSLLSNLGTKLVSLVIAVVLWVVVLGSRNVEVSKEVPLEILTPPELVVANEMPERLTFRISGPKAFLRSVLDRREEPIRVNLIGNKPGLVTYRFFSDHIRLPIGVRVLSVNPSSVLIKLEELKKREVPLKIITQGTVQPGLVIKSIKATPGTVTIKGAESKLEGITEVPSVPIDLTEISSSLERDLPLDLIRLGVQLEGALPKVRVEVVGHGANYKIRNIEVRVLSSHRAKLDPPRISALVHASPTELKKLDRSKIYAILDVEGKDRGNYTLAPTIILPPAITLVRIQPEQVNLTLY